jgi:hypothetical protein
MKTKITFLFILLFSYTLAANSPAIEWLETGTTWYYSVSRGSWGDQELKFGWWKFEVTGESEKDGKIVKILSVSSAYGFSEFMPQGVMLYHEDDKIYHYDWQGEVPEFKLLYDFNVNAGDTIFLTEPTEGIYGDPQTFPVIVDSLYFTTINDYEFASMNLRLPQQHNSFYSMSGPVIKYIGSISYLLLSNMEWGCLGAYIGGLRCFSSGDFFYQVDPDIACDAVYSIPVSVTEILATGQNPIKVYPNPATSGYITISPQVILKGNISLQVFDMAGRLLINQAKEATGQWQINTETLRKGTYLLRVSDQQGEYSTIFMVK